MLVTFNFGFYSLSSGGNPESSCSQAGGEGAPAAEQPRVCGQGAVHAAAGHGDAQEEGHRVRAVRGRSETASGEIPRPDQGGMCS